MRGSGATALLVAVIAGFVAGLSLLFALRFREGDIFPPYSSLRADPLGCKGLAAGVAGVGGITVTRNDFPLARLHGREGRTIFYLGAHYDVATGVDPYRELERLAREGSRVVLALAPVAGEQALPGEGDRKGKEEKPGPPEKADRKTPAVREEERAPSGLAVVPVSGEGKGLAASLCAAGELPPVLPHRSRIALKISGEGWRSLYCLGEGATVAEVPVGKGSMVVVADASLLSNEALRKDRSAPFLAWMLGAPTEVVFDENHFGITGSRGVMDLIAKFRLLPFLGALLLLGGLFVWKNGVPFAATPEGDTAPRAGRDVFSGTVGLLKRHLPRESLPPVILAEWQKSTRRDSALPADLPQEMAEAGRDCPGRGSAAERYEAMREIFRSRMRR